MTTYILGAHGLASEVLSHHDFFQAKGLAGFAVSKGYENGATTFDYPLVYLEDVSKKPGVWFIRGIGNCKVVSDLCEKFKLKLKSFIHEDAFVGPFVNYEEGVVIAPFAVIDGKVDIGYGTYINFASFMGSFSKIGKFCHLAPHAGICDSSIVGDRVWIGAGAIILGKLKIGDDVTIGAGAIVTKDVPAGETWAGVPARKLVKK